ncbi:MAG: helix-turn-helix domain-containing protein [Candidatus Bathyarchaeota archaeon]|nr:helix-turn-helix domain-containing protein [Candidatus Bathyarchaeota archaeon]
MVKKRKLGASVIYAALSHPLRKRIIDKIRESGRAGFKDLKEELQVSVGTLYYHIESLGDLITQDSERKYILTDKGAMALKMFESDEERLESMEEVGGPLESPFIGYLKAFFLPKWLFAYISSSPKRGLMEALVIMALGSISSRVAGLEPILFFYNSRPRVPPYQIFFEFWAGWIVVFLLCEVLTYVLYRRREEHLSLLSGVAFSYLPMVGYSLVWGLCKFFYPELLLNPLVWRVFMLILQVWSMGLLSIAISISKALRIDRAAVVSFLIQYLNIFYVLIFVIRFF